LGKRHFNHVMTEWFEEYYEERRYQSRGMNR
jgi:hypothetical protein